MTSPSSLSNAGKAEKIAKQTAINGTIANSVVNVSAAARCCPPFSPNRKQA